MMKRIELSKITVERTKIVYAVKQDRGLDLLQHDSVNLFIRIHSDAHLQIDLAKIPESVLAIPISLYLIPLTYFYKVEVVVPVMDKTLYNQLPEIYEAYSRIYGPFDGAWRGKLTVGSVVDTPPVNHGKYERIVFFSGGVDACSAGISNPGRKSLLVSIPDIESQAKSEGPLREEKFSLVKRFSGVVDSDWALISNNFNVALYKNKEINRYLRTQLQLDSEAFSFDGWGGIKYLANMCSVAPIAYGLGVQTFIMGSTYEPVEDIKTMGKDGANPLLSDSLKFAGMHFAEQDNLYTRRSEKVRRIITWCTSHGKRIKLWACFSDGSSQCGFCPKCVRTQLNILSASSNPKDWGFDGFDERKFSKFIKSYSYIEKNASWLWDIVDSVDASIDYPYCNKMLHWLKNIGYKEYLNRVKARCEWRVKHRILNRLISIARYPYYMKAILKKLANG